MQANALGFPDRFSQSIEEISLEIDQLEEALSLQEESLRLEEQSGRPDLKNVDQIQDKVLELINVTDHMIIKKINHLEDQVTNIALKTDSNRSYLRDSSEERKAREHYGQLATELADCRKDLHAIRDHASNLSDRIDNTQRKIVQRYSKGLPGSKHAAPVMETFQNNRNIETLLSSGEDLSLPVDSTNYFKEALINYARGGEENGIKPDTLSKSHLFLKTVKQELTRLEKEAPSIGKKEKIQSLQALEQLSHDVCNDIEESFRSRLNFLKDLNPDKILDLAIDLESLDEEASLECIKNCHEIFWEFESPIDTALPIDSFCYMCSKETLYASGAPLEEMREDIELVGEKIKSLKVSQATIKSLAKDYLSLETLNTPSIRSKMIEHKTKYIQRKRKQTLKKYKKHNVEIPTTVILGAGPGGLIRGLIAVSKGADTKIIQNSKSYTRANIVSISPSNLLHYFGATDRLVDKNQLSFGSGKFHVQIMHLEEALHDSLNALLKDDTSDTLMVGYELVDIQIGKNEATDTGKDVNRTGVIIRSSNGGGRTKKKRKGLQRDELSAAQSLEERIAHREKQKEPEATWIPAEYIIDATGGQATSASIIGNEATSFAEKTLMVAAVFKDVERAKRKSTNPKTPLHWSLPLKTPEREYLLIRPTEKVQAEVVESQKSLANKKSQLEIIFSIKDSMNILADKLSLSLKRDSLKYSKSDLSLFQRSLTHEITTLHSLLKKRNRNKKYISPHANDLSLNDLLLLHKSLKEKAEKATKGLKKSIRNEEQSIHELVEKIALRAASEDPGISHQLKSENIEHVAPFTVEVSVLEPGMLFGNSLILPTGDALVTADPMAGMGCEAAILGGTVFSRLLDNHMLRRKPREGLPLYSFGAGKQSEALANAPIVARND
ncbi:MAG: hypothetical protein ACI9S8_003224 [Chlamydiales bacterium]|jgi:hypothetical protein